MISIHLDPEAPGWQQFSTDADMKQIFLSWTVMCRVFLKVRVTFSASGCLLPYFFETPL
jgi:hypothetical protein